MSDPYMNIKIDGVLYPIINLIDKTVYARKDTLLYRYTNDPAKAAKFVVKKGGLIGRIYSWNTKTDGIWFEFHTNSLEIKKQYPSGVYFVKAADISDEGLKEQGSKTTKEQTAEAEKEKEQEKENEKSFQTRLLEAGFKLGITAIAISALTSVISKRG